MRKNPEVAPATRWRAIISLKADIRMAEIVETLCRETDDLARALVGPAFVSRLRGQMRYFRVENGFLGLGKEFPELASQLELHLGNSAQFTAINRPDIRLTLAHLEDYEDNPFARPFRRGNVTQATSRRFVAGQTSLLKFEPPNAKRLIAALCFGFDKNSGGNIPAYTEIRFADSEWQCLNEYHNIRALLLKSREVPVEQVHDTRVTRQRIAAQLVASEKVSDLRHTASRRQSTTKNA